MREYATVEQTGVNSFVVRTTTDELYKIDVQHNKSFKVGDFVLVTYEPTQKVQDGNCYLVRPVRIEASSTRVVRSRSS